LFGDRVPPTTTLPQSGFTNDEESSGIFPVSDILGAGKFLAVVQAHGATKYSDGTAVPGTALLPAGGLDSTTEVVESGQLVVLTYPVPANTAPTGGAVISATAQATALTIPVSSVLATVLDAENDAVAVTAVSILSGDTTGTVKLIGDKIVYTPSAGFTGSTVLQYTITDGVRLSQAIPRTVMLTHTNGVAVYNSGFGSDIFPVPGTSDQFWLVADRGANADGTNPTPAASFQKLFPNPAYSPTLTKVRWNADNSVSVLSSITMKDDSATPVGLTGIPNPINPTFQSDGHIEVANTIFGGALAADAKGIDSESVALDANGNFWVSDEYGPWIVKFEAGTGKTLERVCPYAANTAGHKLPAVFAKRTPGRGMESMTITPDGTKLVGLMQSGLMTATVDTESKGKKVAAARILVYTIATGACEEYVYILDDETTAFKRLVACSISTLDGTTFTVLERDGDFGVGAGNSFGKKKIYSFTLAGATNVNDVGVDGLNGKLFGGLTVEEISGQVGAAATALPAAGITPVVKTLVKDLSVLCDAFPHDKWEGVAARSNGRLVLVNDDDFGIGGTNTLAVKTAPGSSVPDYNQLMEVDPAKMATATGTVTVTVSATVVPNTAPTITNVLNTSTTEDVATSAIGFVIGDTETAATALTVTATSSNLTLVPDANIVLSGTGTGRTAVITPAANQSGTSTITLTVSDGALSASDTFVLTVTAVNDAPVAVNGTATVVAGATVNGTVVATDAETNPLVFSKVANPTQGTVTVNANGTFSYVANAGTTGTDTFTFKANDGTVDSNVATVTVTITAGGSGSGGSGDDKKDKKCGLGGGIGVLVLSLLLALKGLFVRTRR
jgi:VCBS repeat-containing protein